MALSSLRSVGDAIDATRSFLMPPTLGRWSKLALVVAFFGTAGTPVPASPQLLDPRFWRGFDETPTPTGEESPFETGTDTTTANETATAGEGTAGATEPGLPGGELPSLDTIDLSAILPVVIGAVAVLAVLFAGYVLLGILMRFVMVESIRSDDVRLREYAGRHLRNSAGVFGFRLVLGLLAAPVLAVAFVAASPFGPFQLSVLAAGTVSILAICWTTLLLIADAATQQFVIPVMIERDCGVLDGWRRLRPTLLEEWTEYVGFGIVRIALEVAVGIGSAVLLLVAGIVLGILFATIGGVVVLVGQALSAGAFTVGTLVLLASLFALSLVLAFAYVNVPFQVYLWYYALLVLGDIDERFDLIPEQRATARSEDNSVVGR